MQAIGDRNTFPQSSIGFTLGNPVLSAYCIAEVYRDSPSECIRNNPQDPGNI